MKGIASWLTLVGIALGGLLCLAACVQGDGPGAPTAANDESDATATADALEAMANELENGAR